MKLSKHVNRESKNGKLVWHKGPPPHIGWWNASAFEFEHIWRWWDGQAWSRNVNPSQPLSFAVSQASVHSAATEVKWNDSYPAHARVPRYDPRG